jgi:N-methylhydantoinase B/oxoprolinase/acetone carboxylase alpha subunit
MLTLFPTFTALQVAFTKLAYATPKSRTRSIAPWYNMINTYVYGGVNQRGQMVASISANVNGMPGGARDGADGEHSISALFSIMGDLPEIEVQEEEVPYVSLIGKKLLRDNQGFGKFRGGSGYQWAISPKDSPLWGFAAVASGSAYPNVSGMFGGYGCGTYPVCKVRGVDIFERIDANPRAFAHYDVAEIMNLRPIPGARYETQTMAMPFELAQRGEIYLMSQGTGGGWGDVLEREPLAVWRDVRDQILSVEAARTVYAVVLDAQTHSLDEDATEALRSARRADRLAQGRPYAEFIAEWSTPGPQGLPAPYFGCWDKPDEIWMGNEEVPSPADALQPVTMEDPRVLRIRELEAQVERLRAERA